MTDDATGPAETSPARPVLVPVIGVSQRCGTHWLSDLLCLHPGCRRPTDRRGTRGADWEDLALAHAGLLSDYATRTRRRWDEAFRTDELESRLLASLGAGLAAFVADPYRERDGGASHVVTKSPTAEGLAHLPALWPGCRPVLLVRDGADVVASATTSFGGLPERWIRTWRDGARAILSFTRCHPGAGLLVRFEDLVADTEAELRRVCAHIGLEPSAIDPDRVRAVPVRGSSQVAAGTGLHWRPATPAGFDPVGRGRALDPSVRARLGHLAGAELAALGYTVPEAGAAAGQRARDLLWGAARLGRRLVDARP